MNTTFDVNEYWLNRGRTYVGESRLDQPYHRLQERFLVQILREAGFSLDRVLELGCGFGRVTRVLAEQFPSAKILALDLSPDQLDNASRYCASCPEITFDTYDFYSGQPLPGEHANLAIAIEVFLHHPPELIRALLGRMRERADAIVHIDWSESWPGALPEHVWMHDYPAYHQEGGWQCVGLPLPEKVDGKQQVLFVASRSLSEPLIRRAEASREALAPRDRTDPAKDGPRLEDWEGQVSLAVEDIVRVLPEGARFVLVDGNEWGVRRLPGAREAIPCLEREGQYWGPPADDAQACREWDRMKSEGTKYLVVGWNNRWWLDHYRDWARRVREESTSLLDNERVAIFRLR